jgi:hypothetical protein
VNKIHFSTKPATRYAPARVRDWDAVRALSHEKIVQCLQANSQFTAVTNLREQYFQAYNVLQVQHRPAVPFSIIGTLSNTGKTTVRWNYKQCLVQIAHHHEKGRPPILSPQERDDIVPQISDGSANMHPWKIADIIRYASEK